MTRPSRLAWCVITTGLILVAASVAAAQTPSAFTVNNTITGADTADFLVNGTPKVKIDSMGNTTFFTGSLTLNGTALAGTTGGSWTFRNTTDDVVGDATTDVLTNKTFDTAGMGNVFKINSTAISAVTGTGSAVLAASPTLTGATLGGSTTITGTVNLITPEGGSCPGFAVYCYDNTVTMPLGQTNLNLSTGTAVLLRVTVYFSQTRAATTSSSLYLTFFWSDNGSTTTSQETTQLTTNCTPGGSCQGEINQVNAFWWNTAMGNPFYFTATYASNPSSGSSSAQFLVHIRVEAM
jgi:hypothetical protein